MVLKIILLTLLAIMLALVTFFCLSKYLNRKSAGLLALTIICGLLCVGIFVVGIIYVIKNIGEAPPEPTIEATSSEPISSPHFSQPVAIESSTSTDNDGGWVTVGNGKYYGSFNSKYQFDGYGRFEHVRGNIYVGEWKDGERNGFGKSYYKDKNDLYIGMWVNDARTDDDGLYFWDVNSDFCNLMLLDEVAVPDIEELKQIIKGSFFHGSFEDGSIVEGTFYEWKGNTISMNEEGKLVSGPQNHSIYSGSFVDGIFEGHGELYLANGDYFIGEFTEGNLWEGKYYQATPGGAYKEYTIKESKIVP